MRKLIKAVRANAGGTTKEIVKGLASGWEPVAAGLHHLALTGPLVVYNAPHNGRHYFHVRVPIPRRRYILLVAHPKLEKVFNYVRTHEGETPSELVTELVNVYGLTPRQVRFRLARLRTWDFIEYRVKPPPSEDDRAIATGGRRQVFVKYAPGERIPKLRTFEQRRRELRAHIDQVVLRKRAPRRYPRTVKRPPRL